MDPGAAPDRTAHNAVVLRYKRLQLKHGDLVNDRQRLNDELAATLEVLDKLQAEADTLVELMHPLHPETVLSPDYVQLHAQGDVQDENDTHNPYNDPSVPNHREYFLQYHPVNNGMAVPGEAVNNGTGVPAASTAPSNVTVEQAAGGVSNATPQAG